MIPSKSIQMLRRSFRRQTYRFREAPGINSTGSRFGIYVNVPLCLSKCAFCPFYKELYTPQLKELYLETMLREIEKSPARGDASWVYFGGGTPNLLKIEELSRILTTLREKIASSSWGIELHPSLLTRMYLDGLKRIGFTKVSIGVESFDEAVASFSGRKKSDYKLIESFVNHAQGLDLWSNIDIMVGLPNQSASSFLADIQELASINPSQVTIYPYMVIRGVKINSPMANAEQFRLIEEAGAYLSSKGYSRKGVWTFAKGDNVYDSSRDELVEEYIGFGPAAFSTYDTWKVVNPEFDVYLKQNGARKAFVALKTKATDDWRRFARMLYDLQGPRGERFPGYIQAFILLLKLTGYIKNGELTEKGITFAHEVTKSVVESLPFPVQDPDVVENYDEYLALKQSD